MKAVLVSPYELGRQPFALAELASSLLEEGIDVVALDLSQERLSEEKLAGADLVAIYLGMHTATRIALEALPRIKQFAPNAWLVAFGLYAPVNRSLLTKIGFQSIFGGESESLILDVARSLIQGVQPVAGDQIHSKVSFRLPTRTILPDLTKYAYLILPDGGRKMVAFAESSRGCKHLCRHCPVVPVYEGKFRAIPVDLVIEDVAQQVKLGAQHVSFGDPDFWNGPTHALRVIEALKQRFPAITYDGTIKVQHLLDNRHLLPLLRDTGCLFVTCAIESVDDQVLQYLDKNHTAADFRELVHLFREHSLALAPTFIPFTPWTTLESYVDLLKVLVELKLVESVPPVQLSIRLLIPQGSWLLDLEGFRDRLLPFDEQALGYPWVHQDGRVDLLQSRIQAWVESGEKQSMDRGAMFAGIWDLAHQFMQVDTPDLPADLGAPIPAMSEPWYCCAEPTQQQLKSF